MYGEGCSQAADSTHGLNIKTVEFLWLTLITFLSFLIILMLLKHSRSSSYLLVLRIILWLNAMFLLQIFHLKVPTGILIQLWLLTDVLERLLCFIGHVLNREKVTSLLWVSGVTIGRFSQLLCQQHTLNVARSIIRSVGDLESDIVELERLSESTGSQGYVKLLKMKKIWHKSTGCSCSLSLYFLGPGGETRAEKDHLLSLVRYRAGVDRASLVKEESKLLFFIVLKWVQRK